MVILWIFLGYFLPLICCLIINDIINWKDVETLGDLLFPNKCLMQDGFEPVCFFYYLPMYNIFILLIYIITGIIFILYWVVDEIGIVKLVQKIVNIRIKKKYE